MNNDIYLIGEVGYDITLQSVIDMVEQTDKTQPLNVHIHSQGGGVYDGLAIYNYLKGLPQDVHTHSSGLVASIASIIFLAGKKETRKINSTDNFLIHLPSGMNWGNAEDLEKTAEELRSIENKLTEVYENETNLTASEALELMKDDKFLDVNFLKEKGFVNEIIEFKAVASLGNKNNTKSNMSEQLTKKDAENLFEKFFNKFFKSEEKAPDNKIVQDATGVEIDFVNLSTEDNIIEGQEAKVDGKKADGEYLMPNGDKYAFENGILKTIVEKEVSEIENLKAELQTQKDLVATLETDKETLTNELETEKGKLQAIETDFKELKNTVTSNFEIEKEDKPTKEKVNKTRQLFK